ncbi:MAG: hypothetical protein J1E63_07710 [Muribaculaceae bacterium]|nr:hypothetical protein [Muribaculaceae bacterium]
MLKDKSADFNRLIIIKTPGMQKVDFDCQTVEVFTGWIIGTGMTGMPMRLLKAINSGLYFHVDGVETGPREIVHAADLAAAIVALGLDENAPVTVHFHDGTTPRLKEIAEAFATRLNGKRIYMLSRRAAKWVQTLLGTRDLYDLTIEQTSTTQPTEIKGVIPRDTLRFIMTHNYGNEDI